jgi:hypothetical protein
MKKIRFRKVKEEHIDFIKKLMSKQKTRNYSIDRKLIEFHNQFRDIRISRGTLHKI